LTEIFTSRESLYLEATNQRGGRLAANEKRGESLLDRTLMCRYKDLVLEDPFVVLSCCSREQRISATATKTSFSVVAVLLNSISR